MLGDLQHGRIRRSSRILEKGAEKKVPGRSSSGEQKKSLPSPLFVPSSFIRSAAARRAVASPARPALARPPAKADQRQPLAHDAPPLAPGVRSAEFR